MIGAFVGPQGSGKTAFMSLFLYWDWQRGQTIYANYALKFDVHECECCKMHEPPPTNGRHLAQNCTLNAGACRVRAYHYNTVCKHTDDWCGSRARRVDARAMLAFQAQLGRCTIGMTELHVFADARSAAALRNRLLSYWFLQARKRDVFFLYDTQWLPQVDIRLRQQTDMVWKMRNHGDEYRALAYIASEIDDGKPPRRYRVNLKPVYELYDTKEIIDPFEGEERRENGERREMKAKSLW